MDDPLQSSGREEVQVVDHGSQQVQQEGDHEEIANKTLLKLLVATSVHRQGLDALQQ